MSAAPAQFGDSLAAWVDRLDQAGYHIGVRERLLVQSLLARLAADGELPKSVTLEQTLRIVRPILCIQPEQQRRYDTLLRQFIDERRAAKERGIRKLLQPAGPDSAIVSRRLRWLIVAGVAAAVVALAVSAWWWKTHHDAIPSDTGTDDSTMMVDSPRVPTPAVRSVAQPIYVPVGSLAIDRARAIPQWAAPLRTTLLGIGGASLLGLCWLGVARWRRHLYLRGVRTDKEVDEKLLSDPDPISIEPPAPLARRAARSLRQRYAGEALALDIRATLRATVAACGAFSPSYSVVKQTPEYLILIDRRHVFDHHAIYCEALVAALVRNGVDVQVYYFEGSPQSGCWRAQPAQQLARRYAFTSFSELARRNAGNRLVVLAETRALADEATGAPHAWANHLNAFPQRAWLTPMPLASWGLTEQIADSQGFLVLPVQHEALRTLADWFSSERLGLEVAPDWPLSFPALLQSNAVVWVTFVDPPPQPALDELLFQLRAYLGAMRFQWLCACAIFPAISPAVTLALGRELTQDARELALGFAAIGALPWFRHGFMPSWLRLKLIEQLEPRHEASFRTVIEQRLTTAIEGKGMGLASVAQRKNRLAAWLRRGRGPARDIVLVDFLTRSGLTRLAQRLPDALRRRVFRDGVPTYGLRSGVIAVLPVGVLIAAGATSGFWDRAVTPAVPPAVAMISSLNANEGQIRVVAFSPDGRRVLSAGQDGWTVWDVRSHAQVYKQNGDVLSAAFSPDGARIASGNRDSTLQLWNAKTGAAIGEALQGPGGTVTFSPDGSQIASGGPNAGLVVWGAGGATTMFDTSPSSPSRRLPDPVGSIAFSPDGKLLAISAGPRVLFRNLERSTTFDSDAPSGARAVSGLAFSPDGRALAVTTLEGLWLWDTNGQRRGTTPLAAGSFSSVAFSPDGNQILTGGTDGALRLWSAPDGQAIGAPMVGHAGVVQSVRFSPDGKRIVSGGADGTVRLWGEPLGASVDVVDCRAATAVSEQTRRAADQIAADQIAGDLPSLAPVAYAERPPGATVDRSNSANANVGAVLVGPEGNSDMGTQLASRLQRALPQLATVSSGVVPAPIGGYTTGSVFAYVVDLPCPTDSAIRDKNPKDKAKPKEKSPKADKADKAPDKTPDKAADKTDAAALTDVRQTQASPPEASGQTYEQQRQDTAKPATSQEERAPTRISNDGYENVSTTWLARSTRPDAELYAVWVTFTSKAGRSYTAVHVPRQGDPYILLTSSNKDQSDFRYVAQILEKEYRGTGQDAVTDRGDDISMVISVPGGFTQKGIAAEVEQFFRTVFSNVNISKVYYEDSKKGATTN